MKKWCVKFAFLLLILSCKKVDNDDNNKFLYYKLEEIIERDRTIIEGNYLEKYFEIQKDSVKKSKFDSLYKISKKIEKQFYKLNFSNKNTLIKYRDSVIKVHNLPLKNISENDNLNLNDSVFKKKLEFDIIHLREAFHFLKIFDRKEPL